MKPAFLIFISWTLLVFSASAVDEKFPILEVGSTTYTNVTVFEKNAVDLFIRHSGGMTSVKLKNLSPELQAKFGYNPAEATVIEKKRAEGYEAYYQQVLTKRPAPPVTSQTNIASQTNLPLEGEAENKKIWADSFINQKAPELIIEKWLTPQPDMQGKFVLIDFWATWCKPCREAIPELNQFLKKFGDKLIVVGLSDESEEVVRAMKEPAINYSLAIDTQARTKNEIKVSGIPHLILLDPEGVVRWEGFPFLEGHELTEKVVQDILTKFSK